MGPELELELDHEASCGTIPAGIPDGVMKEILLRLQDVVCQELQTLLQRFYSHPVAPASTSGPSLIRTVSQESGSAMSTTSQGGFAFGTWESFIPSLFTR